MAQAPKSNSKASKSNASPKAKAPSNGPVSWILRPHKGTKNSEVYRGVSVLSGKLFEGRDYDESPFGDINFRHEFAEVYGLPKNTEEWPEAFEVTVSPLNGQQAAERIEFLRNSGRIADPEPVKANPDSLTFAEVAELLGVDEAKLRALKAAK